MKRLLLAAGLALALSAQAQAQTQINLATQVRGALPLSNLPQIPANSMLGNWSGLPANALANAMPTCADSGGNHLNYVAGTGITCGTSSGAGAAALSAITAATGANTISSGDNAQTWRWSMTTAAKKAFSFAESAASTNGVSSQVLVDISTLDGSTAQPFHVHMGAANNVISVDNTGIVTLRAPFNQQNAAVQLFGSEHSDSVVPGTVSVTGGFCNACSASAGAVTVTGGANTNAFPGGAVTVTGGAATGANSGAGGPATVAGGAAGATGSGGALTLKSGPGGATSGPSGAVTIASGATSNAATGSVTVKTENASGAGSNNAGDLTLQAGSKTNAGTDGKIVLNVAGSNTALTLLKSGGGLVAQWPANTFANLPSSPANGMMLYCSDCTVVNPCASGGTGAFAKRLNGAWACDGGGGGVGPTLITTLTAAPSNDLRVTGLTGYSSYEFRLHSIVPATVGADFTMVMSHDNGATYTAGPYQYGAERVASDATNSIFNSTSDSSIMVAKSSDSSTSWGINGVVRCFDMAAARLHSCTYEISYRDSFAKFYRAYGAGVVTDATSAVNAVQFLFSAGQIASGGYIEVWGIP